MAEVVLPAREKQFSPVYRWYALGLLFVVYVFNFIDRSILSILLQPIKEDLQVSDTALGFLTGIAFAVFYTALGVPIARLADKGVRRNILVVSLTLWSGMTALCGFAQNFVHLLLARIGVAVGEAGGSPPSHSMISDMFPQHQRGTALGIYALGIPVGSMIGYLAGGWINDALSWREAFMLVGAPGVLLAVLVRLTLKEPPRGMSETVHVVSHTAPPIGDVLRLLWQRRSFRWIAVGAGFQAFTGYGSGAWLPPMFERSHDLSSTEIGIALFWLGVPSVVGTFLGGWVGDRLSRRDVRWYVVLPAWLTLATMPFSAYTYLGSDPWLALWVNAIPSLLGGFWLAPTFALTQGLVGLRMRAVAASIVLFVLNIIGMGLGPQFVGIASDLLNAFTGLGEDSLRWALVSTLAFSVVATFCYLRAATTLKDDLARSHAAG
jgi:predicted MFS family arabinose efflux permease